jgi:hypothetical protein
VEGAESGLGRKLTINLETASKSIPRNSVVGMVTVVMVQKAAILFSQTGKI